MSKPALIVLDDYEGELASSPAMARLRQLAAVAILNRPLTAEDDALLESATMILPLYESTAMDCAFFSTLFQSGAGSAVRWACLSFGSRDGESARRGGCVGTWVNHQAHHRCS